MKIIENGMSAHEMEITPEDAAAILKRSEETGFRNRNSSLSCVLKYTRSMDNGIWGCSNDAICITSDGKLLNGQTRLQSVIRSGKPQRMLVCTDADNINFSYLDSGRPRSDADAAAAAIGITRPHHKTTAAKLMLYMHKKKQFPVSSKDYSVVFRDEINNLLAKHRPLFDEGYIYYSHQAPCLVTSSVFIASYVIFSFINKERSSTFFESFLSKKWEDNPNILALYNAIAKLPVKQSPLRTAASMKYFIKVWNTHGIIPKRLTISKKNDVPYIEDFNSNLFYKDVLIEGSI